MRFRIATINALGHSHTKPGGNKDGRGWLQAARRTVLLVQVITARKYSIATLQEFQTEQQTVFHKRTKRWGMHNYADNAVVWSRPLWKKLDQGYLEVPYFHGHLKKMPWVTLKRRSPFPKKRRVVCVQCSHNPASVRGPAEKDRFEGFRLENEWVEQKLKDPEIDAVIIAGDKNDTAKDYLDFVRRSAGDWSHIPQIWGIDWIVGWGAINFIRGRTWENRKTKRMTDHPVSDSTAIVWKRVR